MTDTQAGGERILIQTVAMPDPEICADDELFLRRTDGVVLDYESGALGFVAGAAVGFDTYFNLFDLGLWTGHAGLAGLALRLRGKGRVAVQILRGRVAHRRQDLTAGKRAIHQRVEEPDAGLTRDRSLVYEAEVMLTLQGVEIPLAQRLGAGDDGAEIPPQDGLMHLRVSALEDGASLTGASWFAAAPRDAAPVRLAMSVTSYRREAETAATVRRITRFLDETGAGLGAALDLVVIDNGRTLELPPHPRLRVVPNPNLGGAGGFARGLAEARAGGYTHVLFCDDDAAFLPESLVRTVAFLRLARCAKASVAGAMISAGAPWAMWENGAIFDRACRPQFLGTDLRRADRVGDMVLKSARPKAETFYGGWWYFAFPISAVRHDPFPFFVRGDDISFSLANDFDISTINGVVSFQGDFAAKESPVTLYLDLRNHLHHHLVHPFLEIGALGTAKVALWFILRSVVRMHYESAEAQLEAWADVMKGPDFFANNVDMAQRLPEIAALIDAEAWRERPPLTSDMPDPREPGLVYGRLMRNLGNGLLVPFWGLLGRSVVVPMSHRSLIWPTWGARKATFYDASGRRGYVVRHDKRRAWSVLWRAGKMAWAWYRGYGTLRAAHRKGYAQMTPPEFWQAQFGEGGEKRK